MVTESNSPLNSPLNSPSPSFVRTHRSMATWSQVIESYEAVPQAFQSACERPLATIQPFPHVVFAPVINSMRRKTTERLLCELDDTLYVWERVGSQIVAASYPLAHVSDLEIGQILLYSWLTISGLTDAGQPTSVIIEFNTVSRPVYEPFIHKIRPEAQDTSEEQWKAQRARFNYLDTVNYKFMNYARESLVRGEQVIHTIWQPKMSRPILTLFGRSFNRTVSLAHLAILTDKEVIFIGDDNRFAEARSGHYGGVWQYIRLRHIMSAAVTEQADGLFTLTLRLSPGGRQLDKLFTAVNQFALTQFQEQLERMIGAL
ncbi:MAG: hypothetical protein IPM39_03195 [Chloroflexi bacterium]|nr:hypothetical protein [Chloroflexota bacterium]